MVQKRELLKKEIKSFSEYPFQVQTITCLTYTTQYIHIILTEIKYYLVKQIKVRQGTEVWDRVKLFPELKIFTRNITVGFFSHIQKNYPTNQKLKYFSPPKC